MPEFRGFQGVPDPLVILWGLLNAGLDRGSGGLFLAAKPRGPPENILIIRALSAMLNRRIQAE
jgi:hypothetical protein